MFTLIAMLNGNQYEGSFAELSLAERKRDLLVERGAAHWLILDDDGVNTREISRGGVQN